MTPVLIAGVGNVLLGDDGVGPYIINLLNSRYAFGPDVEIEDFGTPALDFIDNIVGREALIIIDSVDNGAVPGTVTLYRKKDIVRNAPSVRMDPHSPALVESLLTADLFGASPADVMLVGVTGASYQAGCELSRQVKHALHDVIAAVLVELDRLGVEYQLRRVPVDPAMWWSKVLPATPVT